LQNDYLPIDKCSNRVKKVYHGACGLESSSMNTYNT